MERDDAWHQTDRLHASTGKGDPFAAAMRATRMPMIISDPKLPDNPIVYVNDAFLRLTGYDRDEIMMQNCRFLQGPLTDMAVVAQVRDAVKDRRDIAIDVLNYRKDGSQFWNALYVSPVFDEAGQIQFFFASQLDVSDRKKAELEIQEAKDHLESEVRRRTDELETTLRELQASNAALEQALETKTALVHEVDHRVKNNLQMISALLMMQSRSVPDPNVRASLMELLSRIEALGTVHRRLYQSSDITRFDVGDFLKDLIGDLSGIGGKGRIKTIVDVQPVDVPAEDASAIALIVNEVATNTFKHAFPGDRSGVLTATVKRYRDDLRIEIADNGIGIQASDTPTKTFGTSLIETLGKQLKATLTWSAGNPGTTFSLVMPIRSLAAAGE